MDDRRFDSLARTFAAPKTRRGLLGSLAALGAGLLGARTYQEAGAQVSQVQCGNQFCASNPGGCNPGCVCCVYPNGNSRCRPPGQCTSPGTVATTTTTSAPTTTTMAPCPSGLTRCGEACVDTVTAPTNCGACGTRCPVNETCVAGACSCQGDASVAPATCCPQESGAFSSCASPGENTLTDPATCSSVFECPVGTFPCVGVEGEPSDPYDTCQVCCPLGTICDPLGFCRQ